MEINLINQKPNHKATKARYYDMQELQDDLYARSKAGEIFGDLWSLIVSPNNLKLTYRTIKSNKGSHTPGTDGKTIEDIARLSDEDYLNLMISKLSWLQPKKVRRVEIPKPNGKKRPLGIPCIEDRLAQQAILQILEPIMEAKFSPYSYGFRPNKSAEHAINECYRLMQRSHCTYAIDFDIKSFFDEVNHRKLMRQLWTLGIRDTKLLQIIKQMLKAPIVLPSGQIEYPTKGTPQGGILSPLLANVVLNELDWWLSSQWKDFHRQLNKPPKPQYNKNGNRNLGSEYTAMRKTKLKEFYFVRYADDFKIFCKTRKEAVLLKHAITQWLSHRLKLQISPEKTKIVNLKKNYSEFLGFKLKLQPKSHKWVVNARMSDKTKANTRKQLSKQLKNIQKPKSGKVQALEIDLYNSMVMGIQNYYGIANNVTKDLAEIQRTTSIKFKNRFGKALKKEGQIDNIKLKERYGKSKQVRWINGKPVIPIGFYKSRNPMAQKAGACQYTPEGRGLLQKKIPKSGSDEVMHYLMTHPVRNASLEYNDNRISLYAGQHGKCGLTGQELVPGDIHCHHKLPRKLGGKDNYQNLILLTTPAHKLVHATNPDTISYLSSQLRLDGKQLKKLNKLRKTTKLEPIQLATVNETNQVGLIKDMNQLK
ncbi:group II intron reverse transcriptase/maturase [Peptococcus niger]|uniref:Group II intron reverse transcriptase/maturase n=2 Tax=Peptococcus niger TaxID=2741 RepID=A0A1G6UA32_PEPNI|nr:group II intron reverse transcriptase/maturase [Peptococcus niger]SDE11625.1 group II intron reverse transcriptase/maturase [Peptococcus niger]SDE14857.1 group II intron reverse transcriptase/maturase [Peptococcus niger]